MDMHFAAVVLLAGLSAAVAVWLAGRRLSDEARAASCRRHLLRRVGIETGAEEAGEPRRGGLLSLGLALAPRGAELAGARRRLGMAGFRDERHLALFFLIKNAGGVGGLVIAVILWLFGIAPGVVAFALPLALFYGPDLAVRILRDRRLQEIDRALPEFIDLCSICMTAGLGWLAAVQRVVAELMHVHPVICREFRYVTEQIKAGMSRTEALQQLAERNPTGDVRHLVQVLVQNERQGSPIVESLRSFSLRVYAEREQYMEEKAGKVSAKMALIIFPFMLVPFTILVVGEQMVNLMRSL